MSLKAQVSYKLFTSATEIDKTSGIGRMWNAASEKFGFIRKGTQCCASVHTSALLFAPNRSLSLMETLTTVCASKRTQTNYSKRSQDFVNHAQLCVLYRQILRLCNKFLKSSFSTRLKSQIYSFRKSALSGFVYV